jgi:hypothetical protein
MAKQEIRKCNSENKKKKEKSFKWDSSDKGKSAESLTGKKCYFQNTDSQPQCIYRKDNSLLWECEVAILADVYSNQCQTKEI